MRTSLLLLVTLLGFVAMATATTVAPTAAATTMASEGPSESSTEADSATNVHISLLLMVVTALFQFIMRQ